jgi:trehalose-6-phosphate synthase
MRMERLYEQVSHYDIDFWAEDFMTRVHDIRDQNLPAVPSEKPKAAVAVEA